MTLTNDKRASDCLRKTSEEIKSTHKQFHSLTYMEHQKEIETIVVLIVNLPL
jgi:hypothetical protein